MPLNAKETALLDIFLRRPNVLHASESLWAAAWREDADGWYHTLDSRISALRSKLGSVWGRRLVCQKGQGYNSIGP